MKVLVVLPTGWQVELVRYIKANVEEPEVWDLQEIDTPLDDPDSYLNYQWKTVKKYGKLDK